MLALCSAIPSLGQPAAGPECRAAKQSLKGVWTSPALTHFYASAGVRLRERSTLPLDGLCGQPFRAICGHCRSHRHGPTIHSSGKSFYEQAACSTCSQSVAPASAWELDSSTTGLPRSCALNCSLRIALWDLRC